MMSEGLVELLGLLQTSESVQTQPSCLTPGYFAACSSVQPLRELCLQQCLNQARYQLSNTENPALFLCQVLLGFVEISVECFHDTGPVTVSDMVAFMFVSMRLTLACTSSSVFVVTEVISVIMVIVTCENPNSFTEFRLRLCENCMTVTFCFLESLVVRHKTFCPCSSHQREDHTDLSASHHVSAFCHWHCTCIVHISKWVFSSVLVLVRGNQRSKLK